MTDIPMKSTWMGEDIETLPREKLIEIIHHLGQEVESTRASMRRHIEMERMFANARAKYSWEIQRCD